MSSTTERELLPTTKAAPGTLIRYFVDDSKAADDIDSRHLHVIYDGLPGTPVFKVAAHWHSDHNEHWTMLRGRMIATIGGQDVEMKVGDSEVVIPAGVVHYFRAIKGVPAILKERSTPPGPYKALTMRDIFQLEGPPTFWLALRASLDSATYLHLGGPLILDQMFMFAMYPIARVIAPGKRYDGDTRAPRKSKTDTR